MTSVSTSLPDDAIAPRFDEYGYAMVVNASNREKLLGWFATQMAGLKPRPTVERRPPPAVAAATPVSTLPAGYPQSAQKAPDGKWYVPDPAGGWRPIIPRQASP
jgi:hypothetical protein